MGEAGQGHTNDWMASPEGCVVGGCAKARDLLLYKKAHGRKGRAKERARLALLCGLEKRQSSHNLPFLREVLARPASFLHGSTRQLISGLAPTPRHPSTQSQVAHPLERGLEGVGCHTVPRWPCLQVQRPGRSRTLLASLATNLDITQPAAASVGVAEMYLCAPTGHPPHPPPTPQAHRHAAWGVTRRENLGGVPGEEEGT